MKVKSIFLAFLFFVVSGCAAGGIPSTVLSDHPSRLEHNNNSVVALVRPNREELEDMGIERREDIRATDSVDTIGRVHSPYCAGVVVSSTQILTAAHCVQRVEYISSIFGPISVPSEESPVGDVKKISFYSQYMTDKEKITTYRMYRVTKWERDQDLALLEILENQTAPVHTVIVLGDHVTTGERSYAVGHPAGIPWTLTDGLISRSKRVMDDGTLFVQTSSLSYYGNSGGPLFNERSEVIGICSWGIRDTAHLTFFVHPDAIEKFLNDQ